jgi:cytochrome P450
MVSQFLEAEVDGERLTQEEILDIGYLFVIAGLDTVTDSLTCFFHTLATRADLRRRLADDPDVTATAVEELLRWETPVPGVARVLTQDTVIGGCPAKAGDSVLVSIGSANTDETAFERADEIDFDRSENRHLAFGGGIHRCLGSHLARHELRLALREWHRRIPDYHIAEGAELQWAPMLRQVEHLPLVFDEICG